MAAQEDLQKETVKKKSKNNSDELHNYNNRSQLHKCLSIISNFGSTNKSHHLALT